LSEFSARLAVVSRHDEMMARASGLAARVMTVNRRLLSLRIAK
jgi:hypothetical protein